MIPEGRLQELVRALRAKGLAHVEVYRKEGRSRRFSRMGPCTDVQVIAEEGWAVRGGGPEGGFFDAGTGRPRADREWPEPAGEPLRLPASRPAASWVPARDLDLPLMGERQGLELLAGIEGALAAELPGARLEQASLEDGSSASWLESSSGIGVGWRHRVAALYLEASWREAGARAELYLAEGVARGFRPSDLGRALADRLFVAGRGVAPEREGGKLLLSPAVGARILEGLRPLWLGRDAPAVAEALKDREGRLASSLFDLVDDGRYPQGPLAAPVDGEGVPTGRIEVISEGIFRQPLLPWWEAAGQDTPGCCWRRGWRDPPRPGPGHLFLAPRQRVAPTTLVAGISRGAYLLQAGSGAFDFREQRFALPVSGFSVRDGVARSPIAEAWLCGDIAALLRGLQGVARDLRFFPLGGMIGSPSLLVSDLELRGAP